MIGAAPRTHAQQAAHSLTPDSAVVLYCAAWNTDAKSERDRLLARFRKPDGSEVANGMDFFELAEDGRIRRVTGFFGAPPVIKP